MLTIRNELNEKIEEATILLEHIRDITNQVRSVQKASILKSAYVILLYNVVESTTRLIFESVHDNLALYEYYQLSEKIKSIYNKFHFKKYSIISADDFDYNQLSNIYFPLLEEYIKYITLYSGNLDGRELNKIIEKYNIGSITCISKKNLSIIKNKRNKLAHGEEKFKDACRCYTINELNIFKDSVYETMLQLIDQTDTYLSNKRYLI